MSIGELCRSYVVKCPVTYSINVAAQLMKRHNIEHVIIVDEDDENKVLGVLTDRDITIRIFADGMDSSYSTVGDIME